MPSHLGDLFPDNSMRTMYKFTYAIGGFSEDIVYYIDIDSLYIEKICWSVLEQKSSRKTHRPRRKRLWRWWNVFGVYCTQSEILSHI